MQISALYYNANSQYIKYQEAIDKLNAAIKNHEGAVTLNAKAIKEQDDLKIPYDTATTAHTSKNSAFERKRVDFEDAITSEEAALSLLETAADNKAAAESNHNQALDALGTVSQAIIDSRAALQKARTESKAKKSSFNNAETDLKKASQINTSTIECVIKSAGAFNSASSANAKFIFAENDKSSMAIGQALTTITQYVKDITSAKDLCTALYNDTIGITALSTHAEQLNDAALATYNAANIMLLMAQGKNYDFSNITPADIAIAQSAVAASNTLSSMAQDFLSNYNSPYYNTYNNNFSNAHNAWDQAATAESTALNNLDNGTKIQQAAHQGLNLTTTALNTADATFNTKKALYTFTLSNSSTALLAKDKAYSDSLESEAIFKMIEAQYSTAISYAAVAGGGLATATQNLTVAQTDKDNLTQSNTAKIKSLNDQLIDCIKNAFKTVITLHSYTTLTQNVFDKIAAPFNVLNDVVNEALYIQAVSDSIGAGCKEYSTIHTFTDPDLTAFCLEVASTTELE